MLFAKNKRMQSHTTPTHFFRSLLIVCMVFILQNLHAQDVHFSQFDRSPLTLNPALAGANNTLQGMVNYRTQWKSLAQPYTTMGASVNGRVIGNNRTSNGFFAMGANFYNDAAGMDKVITTTATLNLAYHIKMDQSNTLGMGLYSGFGQRTMGYSSGKWASQFNGIAYDSGISSGESIYDNKFSYFDAGAGIVLTHSIGERYMFANSDQHFNMGLAVYHLNRPRYSILKDDGIRLPMRFSAFFSGLFAVQNTSLAFLPSMSLQFQGTAKEIVLGTYVRHTVSEGSKMTGKIKESHLAGGLFYRYRDAVIAKIMYEHNNMSGGFSYDINMSKLAASSRSTGAMELFLGYTIR